VPETTSTTGTGSTSSSTTEDETNEDSSTTEGPVCNNGVVEGDEECDNAQVSLNGPCLPSCILNVCGDGYQNLEAEGCDEGDQNGMYGVMCDSDCQVDGAQYCGDGLVQSEYEDCESDEVHDEFDIECQDCSWAGFRVVFVTTVAFDGAMEGGGLDNEPEYSGVTLADYRCQQLADIEELPGTYHAWLSDNNGTDNSSAADRIGGTDSVAYRMRNGGIVANSWSSLLADGPNKAIINTELGEPHPNLPTFVWTNTDTSGQPLGADCGGWTDATIFEAGALGTTTTEDQWTNADVQPCQYAYPLYCFQGEE